MTVYLGDDIPRGGVHHTVYLGDDCIQYTWVMTSPVAGFTALYTLVMTVYLGDDIPRGGVHCTVYLGDDLPRGGVHRVELLPRL